MSEKTTERWVSLETLAEGLEGARILGSPVSVCGVCDHTDRIQPGELFVALKGRSSDGHELAGRAVERGAAALLVERPLPLDVPQVVVPDTWRAYGLLAANFWGRPAQAMTGVAVTGTNGKTTITYMLEAVLRRWGRVPGVLGTVSYRVAGRSSPAPYTTPTPGLLHRVLAEMREARVSHYLMEVSSHALEMGRVEGLVFQVAGFTNLTQDHLDLHGTMEAYFAAKQRLFAHHLVPDGVAVAWLDDPSARRMLGPFSGRKIFCSAQDPSAEVFLEDLQESLDGFSLRAKTPAGPIQVRSRLVGRTNVTNTLLAIGMALGLGVPLDVVAAGLEDCRRVPGRLDPVRPVGWGGPAVFVDYAHTPDAIARVLETLRPLTRGRLFIVFGCGGDRDRGKRPLMGRAAAEGADLVVVTSDNPRTEDPLAIIDMAEEGVQAVGLPKISAEGLAAAGRGYVVESDRRRAIGLALQAAEAEDVVLIAGKGHEDYQILGRRRIHFDDREEAEAALAALERQGRWRAEGGGTC